MTTSVQVEWQYSISAFGSTLPPEEFHRFFRQVKKDRYQKSLSLTPRYTFAHHTLVPNGNLIERLNNTLPGSNMGSARNFPFSVRSSELTEVLDGRTFLVNGIQVNVFKTGIIVLRIKASIAVDIFKNVDACLRLHCSDDLLLHLRLPKKIKVINDIADEIIDKVTVPGWKPKLASVTRSAFKIEMPFNDVGFRRYVDISKRNLIATHLGVHEGSGIAANLVQELEHAWKSLNLKSQTEWMLANTLGLTYLVPKDAKVGPHPNRFERATDLLALASYLQILLLDPDDQAANNKAAWQEELDLARRWVEFSKNALYASVSNWALFEVLSDSMSLKTLVAEIRGIDRHVL